MKFRKLWPWTLERKSMLWVYALTGVKRKEKDMQKRTKKKKKTRNPRLYIVAETIKHTSILMKIVVASKSDFVPTKFCLSICKDVLLTEPRNLYDLNSCTDSNECFYGLLNVYLGYKILSSQWGYGNLQVYSTKRRSDIATRCSIKNSRWRAYSSQRKTKPIQMIHGIQ